MTFLRRAPVRPWRALAAALLFSAVLASGLAPLRPAEPVAAGTAETMEAKLLSLINAERVKAGLVPLVLHWKLITLSGDRAATLAAKGVLSHSAAGSLSSQLTSRGIQWYSYGEALGSTSWPWGDQAVTSLFNAWKGSRTHWALLMSRTYNYLGIGVAYRSANQTTYSSIVLTESIDQTRPWARMTGGEGGSSWVHWSWTGADTLLQSHTAGFKNFDIEYRVDSGTWTTLRAATTATSTTLTGRARGHWYGLRVRARDQRGIVSLWTTELRIWVP